MVALFDTQDFTRAVIVYALGFDIMNGFALPHAPFCDTFMKPLWRKCQNWFERE